MRSLALNSVRSRLVLLFFVITAAAVGFVYLYVVPQLESNLTAQKISRLQDQGNRERARLAEAMRAGLSQEELSALVNRMSQTAAARLTILGIPEEGQLPFVIADSEPERGAVSSGFGIGATARGRRRARRVSSRSRARARRSSPCRSRARTRPGSPSSPSRSGRSTTTSR